LLRLGTGNISFFDRIDNRFFGLLILAVDSSTEPVVSGAMPSAQNASSGVAL
jgi:hypothetical protein